MSATVHSLADQIKQKKLGELFNSLIRSDKDVPLAIVSNIVLILSHDPELAGMLGFNEFTLCPMILRSPPKPFEGAVDIIETYPRPWAPADVSYIQIYIQRAWIKNANRSDTEDAMLAVANRNRFHPVRDWLSTLIWDGKQRLNDWLRLTFGCPEDDYHTAIAACFLIAAVRRVRKPGCKFDHMLILEGLQNLGKSTALRILFCDRWFSDAMPADLGSKEAAQALIGVWGFEMAEIEQMIRLEVEVIKAFISRPEDRFRAPYGRTFMSYPRQCVLAGTTNDAGYLRDSTGNRRFWPAACSFVDLDWLACNREQLWAEAAAREASGEDHWLSDQDAANGAKRVQLERQSEDVWEDRIDRIISGRSSVTIGDILNEMSVPTAQQGKREQMRVSAVLKQRGWERKQFWDENRPLKRWVRGTQ